MLGEVLQQASKNCDVLLLLGNIFSDNNPSHKNLTDTLSLLKDSVLGDKSIGFSSNYQGSPTAFNYNDSRPL